MKRNIYFIGISVWLSLLAAILLTSCNSSTVIVGPDGSPYADKVYEYMPAPGQFINDPQQGFREGWTRTDAAEYAREQLKKDGGFVSLGGFGGYIVVGFDHRIPNAAAGRDYDFAIGGNQYYGSSEPGIVWVMEDANGNGLPDDTWYELYGSESEKAETIRDYAVTYKRPSSAGSPVEWTDNHGDSGTIDYLGSFHGQDYYYPDWIAENEYTLTGTRLEARNKVVDGKWVNDSYYWGYADNYGADHNDPLAGKGAYVTFRISYAMDSEGSPVHLPYIDFIKVQTGVNAKSGPLGEVSTEVFFFEDLHFGK